MKTRVKLAADWVAARFERAEKTGGKRVLVNEILSLQVLSAALVGALAIASLYWGGQWVLQDNYSRWAMQWTEDLNELGAPLYLANDKEALIRLESFVERYPEIDRVAYFSKDGAPMFSVDNKKDLGPVIELPEQRLEDAINRVGDEEPYLMRSGVFDPRQFEILAPVWTESISDDGLFAFDPSGSDRETAKEIIGFVAIHLNFLIFHDRLMSNIRIAILVLLALLIAFGFYGRHMLRRALASISDLQAPIEELAKGNLAVKFEPAAHREISDIVKALETTASALSERDEKLVELANHDSLTGLLNRRRFIEELKKEIGNVMRHGRSSALLFIDLDQFKYVNDACGHPAGDRLLRKVADELNHSTRSNDIVARFGGDEFVVLVCRTDIDGARAAAETILTNMRRMAHIEGERIFNVHCSIGVTMLDGDDINQDELVNQADIACRDAKLAGRNRMSLYEHSEESLQRDAADVGWMNRLRKALDDDEFELRFQPINRIETGETMHQEVLIRLRTADGKVVRPDAFLPSAIRFGLMTEIDFWVIRNAAEAHAKYSKPDQRLKLAVNLSANVFENDNLVAYVDEMFKKHGVRPNDIVFEITESLAIRRPSNVETQIAALHELGYEFSLDDFGTGYNSFSYLQNLKFDYIKIDGSFVEDLLNNPVDQKMIKLIAEIGREAGMKTIAEYVQNAESLILLGELGVDMAQGYFVGRPTKRPQPKSTPISINTRRAKRNRR